MYGVIRPVGCGIVWPVGRGEDVVEAIYRVAWPGLQSCPWVPVGIPTGAAGGGRGRPGGRVPKFYDS